MNIHKFLIFATSCVIALILNSCESHEQKADDAFDAFKIKKAIIKDSVIIINNNTNQEPPKTEIVIKKEIVDEWTKFKIDIENKIIANDKKIKEIKSIPNLSAKLLRKVKGLEKDNNDLRRQIDEYKEEVKVKWEQFKTDINHGTDEISIELKDLIINNKK